MRPWCGWHGCFSATGSSKTQRKESKDTLTAPVTYDEAQLQTILAAMAAHYGVQVKYAEERAQPPPPLRLTAPGARYDAETRAVIRIKTIKGTDDGISLSSAVVGRYNGMANALQNMTLKYRRHGLELFGGAYLGSQSLCEENTVTLRSMGQRDITIEEGSDVKARYTLADVNGGINYDINERHFFLSPTLMAMIDLSYRTRDRDVRMDYKERGAVNVRVMKSLLHRSPTISLYGNDLLRTMNRSWTMHGDHASTSRDYYGMVREVGVQLVYNLHPTKNRYRGTGAGQDERARL